MSRIAIGKWQNNLKSNHYKTIVKVGLVWVLLFNTAYAKKCFSDPKLAYEFLVAKQAQTKNAVININTATPAELMNLQGVGVKTAEAIVEYRQGVGRFSSIDELLKVKGIGQATLAKNRHRLTVQ